MNNLMKTSINTKMVKELLSTSAANTLVEKYGWMLILAPFASQLIPALHQLADKALDNFEEINVKIGDASIEMKGRTTVTVN